MDYARKNAKRKKENNGSVCKVHKKIKSTFIDKDANKKTVNSEELSSVNKKKDQVNGSEKHVQYLQILENIYNQETEKLNVEYDKNDFMGWLTTQKVKFDLFKGKICDATLKALAEMEFTHLTPIQLKAIPVVMAKVDVIAIAKTGSGKTLAFLIPVIQHLYNAKIKAKHGTVAVILSPTRELAIQTHEVLKKLLMYHTMTCGLAIGGVKLHKEAEQFVEGVNILVATPGRLLDHLYNTENFKYKRLKCLVIDEVDRMLDTGFEKDMKKILEVFSIEGRQTLMFSATKTERVWELKSLALRNNPVSIGDVKDSKESTVSTLEQYYSICPSEKRLLFLHATLKKLKNKKVMVFFSTTSSVNFHYKFFSVFNTGMNLMYLHGQKDQAFRTRRYFEFCNSEFATLFCTDVAARGLDIPEVDFILQYDPPNDPKEYIHRVGRTARGEGKSGQALLVLRPEENEFIRHLTAAKVYLTEYNIPWEKIKDNQSDMESIIQNDYDLRMASKKAFCKYVSSYVLRTLRDVFDVQTLDIRKVAISMGWREPPRTDFDFNVGKRKKSSLK